MKDLLTQDGKPEGDLSKRMADNVVDALVDYMETETALGAERVHAYSTALSSLSLLAIAEQLQALASSDRDVADGKTCIWKLVDQRYWIGSCDFEIGLDGELPEEAFAFCPGCGNRIESLAIAEAA